MIFILKQTFDTGVDLRNNLTQHPIFKDADIKSQRVEVI